MGYITNGYDRTKPVSYNTKNTFCDLLKSLVSREEKKKESKTTEALTAVAATAPAPAITP